MKELFIKNREKLSAHLSEGEMVILFQGTAPKATADAFYTFKPNKNFFYFTGLNQENFIVAMHKQNGELHTTLFVEFPNYDVEKWYGRKLSKEAATDISGIEAVQYTQEFETWLTRLIHTNKIAKLTFDLEKLSFDEADSYSHMRAMNIQKRFPFMPIGTVHPICVALRMIKEPQEIEQMKKAVEITNLGLKSILDFMKPGAMEYQLESTFAHTIRMNGADGNSFPTIAAGGSEAVILHYVENSRVLEENTMVLIDLGAQYKEYAADITRTYPVSGKYSPRQKQIYDIVLKAEQAVIASMKPGLPFTALNETCRQVLSEELIKIGLISSIEELSKYYYHGVSHHLGLDVHDISDREAVLMPGMVLTVEPGLYIAEEGIGVRIEDDVLITENGHEVLSEQIIRTTEEIESYMANRQ